MEDKLKREFYKVFYDDFERNTSWDDKRFETIKGSDGLRKFKGVQVLSGLRFLESKGLLIKLNSAGTTYYVIDCFKRKEWEDLLNPPNWLRRNKWTILKLIGAGILWVSSILISTYLTKTVEKDVDDINKRLSEWGIGSKEKEEGETRPKAN